VFRSHLLVMSTAQRLILAIISCV